MYNQQAFDDFYENLVGVVDESCEQGNPPHQFAKTKIVVDAEYPYQELHKINFDMPSKSSQISPSDRHALLTWRSSLLDNGERLAFYLSFHFCRIGWGIYYNADVIRRMALDIMDYLWTQRRKEINPENALENAFNILRLHEWYHYEFDLYVTRLEIEKRMPLYLTYSRDVYSKNLKLKPVNLYEESLAVLREVSLSNPLVMEFAKRRAIKSPPGYRNYRRNMDWMRHKLQRQVEQTHRRANLQGINIATEIPPNPLKSEEEIVFECPEYIVLDDINGRPINRLIKKSATAALKASETISPNWTSDPNDPLINKYSKPLKKL